MSDSKPSIGLIGSLKQRKVATGLLCLAFFLIIRFILSHAVLSSFSGLYLTLELEQQDRFTVYFSAGERAHFTEQRTKRSNPISAGTKIVSHIALSGHIARKLRLDPGDKVSQVKLYALKLESNYGGDIEFDAQQLYDKITPNDAIKNYTFSGDHISFRVDGVDPQLILNSELVVQNRFISLVFPFILTLVFYLLLSSFRWREFPAFADLKRDLTSTHINYGALDGIRGIAVLLVLADHTLPAFTGAGTAGVWIFFVLSGFLLTIPFVNHPERAISPGYMREYLVRRLKRIIPMYYVYVFVVFFLHGKFGSDAVRHMLFLQGDGHLWTIQQEMLFYLVLPLIMAFNYLVFRGRAIPVTIGLALMMLASNIWLDQSIITMHSVLVDHRTYAGIFICGMLFSYLYHGGIIHRQLAWAKSRNFKFITSLVGVILLGAYILLGTDTLFSNGYYPAIASPGKFGIAAGLIILLALMSSGQFFNRLLSYTPLRAIGLVGYSFYLVHPILITLVNGMWTHYLGYNIGLELRFVLVLILTYIVSALTYTYIERPFLKRAG